jgi:lysosomal acid lipase/cholesteryl ester hydrolase
LIEDLKSPVLPLPAQAKESVPDQVRAQGLQYEDFEVTT